MIWLLESVRQIENLEYTICLGGAGLSVLLGENHMKDRSILVLFAVTLVLFILFVAIVFLMIDSTIFGVR
jgi:hypothetical protein